MVPSGAVATPFGKPNSSAPQLRRKQGGSGHGQGQSLARQVSPCPVAALAEGSHGARSAASIAPSTLRREAAPPRTRASVSRREDGGTAAAGCSGVAGDRDQLSIRWLFMAGSPSST